MEMMIENGRASHGTFTFFLITVPFDGTSLLSTICILSHHYTSHLNLIKLKVFKAKCPSPKLDFLKNI